MAGKKIKFVVWLASQGACGDAIRWVGRRTAQQAWEQCRRMTWITWLLSKSHPNQENGELMDLLYASVGLDLDGGDCPCPSCQQGVEVQEEMYKILRFYIPRAPVPNNVR